MFNQLILILEKYNYKFVTDDFMASIKKYITNIFTLLNNNDNNILVLLTSYMIDDLIIRYNIKIEQFTQNNGRDIISLCFTLLPFIKDNDNKNQYHMIQNLKDIIYNSSCNSIPSSLLEKELKATINVFFPYSNISLGLLNNRDNNLLELYTNTNNHIIYTIIHNNFVSMLETIKITCGKLYVNWINTVPLYSYKSTPFYNTSRSEINSIIKNPSEDNIIFNIRNNKGLWLGDYYNILTCAYYQSIKSKKWMIFCRNLNNKYYYSIQYLNKIFDINKMFINENYESMMEIYRNEFNNKIILLQNNIKNNISTYIDINFEIDLFKNLFIFMTENFSKKNLLPNFFNDNFSYDINNSKMELDPDEEAIDPENKTIDIDYITNDILSRAFEEIKPDLLWDYIKESLIQLKATVYGSYLIKLDTNMNHIIDMDYFFLKVKKKEEGDIRINLKNIYNIAKLLCHDNEHPEFIEYSSSFKGLTKEQTIDFFKKYSKMDIGEKLKENIKKQEGVMEYNYTDIINQITSGWNKIKQYIIWNYLLYNGLLIEFRNIVVPNMSNKEQMAELKVYFKEKPEIFDSYYFMTNDKYTKLKTYDMTKVDKNIKYGDYLIKQSFSTFYANDWVSQLNFFNHYINKSIIYVTGSTGTGKSTQVPKLTLYILKMYDYKIDGIVICTQPRIAPTEENAKRIASEMGVELQYTKDGEKYNTSNYYIQYKHMKGEHMKQNSSHLVLRMVTDGTLLEDLVTNPLLKEKYKKNRKELKGGEELYSYSIKNKYDVVIVDEAHEHNMNMDIILTLMRQTCIYNNMVRLIIVSATMEDDEPIYRYYYKLVNDNLVYPIKKPILYHPVIGINTENFMINSYLLDRRFNISAPGQTTLYKVTDVYNEMIGGGEDMIQDTMRNNYNIAMNYAYIEITNICKKYLVGDILLFSIGKEEIIESVNKLNAMLPNDVIALPYYSEMASQYRNIINKISDNIGKIRNNKNKIGEEWGAIYSEKNDVPENTYKRAIIIATNVAEASITIGSLKFVVDTGYSKVNRYDVIMDSSNMNIEMISDASRIQRRGRVGRTSDGMVFYMYGKNKRRDIIAKYGITLVDFHSTILKLAVDSTDDTRSNPLWEDILSPYLPVQYKNNYYKIPEIITIMNLYNINNYNILSIIIKQFPQDSMMPINEYFYDFNEYYPNVKDNMSSSLPYYLNRYASGYTKENLFDTHGNFYIVHPFEDVIKRNIAGNIIKYKEKIEIIIPDKAFQYIINNMRVKMLYLDINKNTNRDIKDSIYKKTVYAEKIIEMMRIMSMDEMNSIILMIGAGYNILMETCMVISMIQTISMIQPSIIVLIKKIDKYIMIDEMKGLFKSDSDITSLYYITQRLYKILGNMEIFKLIERYKIGGIENTSSCYQLKYDNMVNLYYKGLIKDSLTLNMFKAMQYNGMIGNRKGFLHWLQTSNFIKDKIKEDIIQNKYIIIRICDNLYLDYNIIIKYFDILTTNILNILASENTVDKSYNEETVFEWVKLLTPNLMKNLKNNTIETKLNLCFLFGQPLIAVKKDDGYINMRDGNIIKINTIFNKMNTLCNNVGSYLYYYSQSKGFISLIANIDPYILPLYYPIHYNIKNIKTIYKLSHNDTIIFKEYNNIEWERLVYIVRNNFSYLSFPFFTPFLPVINEYIKLNLY